MVLPLSDYQEIAKAHLLQTDGLAGLFDVPGVGKTAPAIQAGWERYEETKLPVLITCPAYLCDNWAYEISRFTPEGTTVSIANGNGPTARHTALQADADYVITGYANWSGRRSGLYTYPELATREWAAVILDEGHKIRGRNSQCTKHMFELRKARSTNLHTPIWVLTGTPIVNNAGDIFPLLHLRNRRKYKSYWNFVGEFCRITQTPWATEVGPIRDNMAEEFQNLLGEFSLRRTLADIPSLADLEHVEKDHILTLPKSVVQTIRKARDEYLIEHEDMEGSEFVNGGGALYSKLRQIATVPPGGTNPKLDFVKNFLSDENNSGPVVIYTWYKASAAGIAEGLTDTKRPVTLITGDVPAAKRGQMVDTWTKQKNGVIVATLSSLKEGISLIHARDVIFLEHSELPSDQDQCIARLKRRGQTELVRVHHVFARSTPDMSIKRVVRDRTQDLKRALISYLKEDL